jgi:predicted flap endonuclease-1-like 5' DNA nuclease
MSTNLFALLAQSSSGGGIPWWVWVILILILLVILWFWFGREEEEASAAQATKAVEVPKAETVAEPVPQTSAKPDDLKVIEGIGPKVASLLNGAGITSFQQMVDVGAEKLESILNEAGLHMIDADTWPEQATLAASGDWEALKKLQSELKGGKHV